MLTQSEIDAINISIKNNKAMTKEEILNKQCNGDLTCYENILAAMEEYAQQQLAPSWVKASERLPVGVTSFETMSKHVAVRYYNEYDKAIRTSSGRYCHDRNKWFVGGQNEENNNECDVIEWLDEQPAQRAAQTDVATDDDWKDKRIKKLESYIKWALDNPQSIFVFNELKKALT